MVGDEEITPEEEGVLSRAEKKVGQKFIGTLERNYNLALARILYGKPARGGYMHALSVVSGIAEKAIQKRVERLLEREPDIFDTEEPGLSVQDGRYFETRYRNTKDPLIRDFLASLKRREG